MIEIVSVISSLLCVYLTAKKNILCWPVGIIAVLGYMWIFYEGGQYANTGLQLVFLIQSIFAWWNWGTDKLEWSLPTNKLKIFSIFIILLGILIYSLLIHTGSAQPELDAITTSLSLVGMLLLAYKKYEAWIAWIIADILYVIMFAIDGEILLMLNYVILLGLASWGFIKWKRENGRIENRG